MIQVEELPCGKWTEEYKQLLCQLVEKGDIKSFAEKHTNRNVHFTIVPSPYHVENPEQFIEKLKLKSNISLQNMVAFDPAGVLKRYNGPEQIINDFFPVRLQGYEARKQALMRRLIRDEAYARNKSLFVAQIISGKLDIFQFTGSAGSSDASSPRKIRGLSELEIMSKLIQAGFLSKSQIESLSSPNAVVSQTDDSKQVGDQAKPDFSYLLEMPIQSLTESRFESLRQQADTAAARLRELETQSAADLWLRDLELLEEALKPFVM